MSPKPTRRIAITGGVVAVLIGALVVSPAVGGPTLLTLGKAKQTFITKKRANKRFYTKKAANGRFLPKTGEIRWSVPPSEWVAATGSADVTFFSNVTQLEGSVNNSFFNAPIQIPVTFLGRSATLKRIELCYQVFPGATLDAIQIVRMTPTSADSTASGSLVIDDDVSLTNASCRTVTPAAPVALGPNDILQAQLRNDYAAASTVDVSRLTVVLGL